jgi:hypothetical protein
VLGYWGKDMRLAWVVPISKLPHRSEAIFMTDPLPTVNAGGRLDRQIPFFSDFEIASL